MNGKGDRNRTRDYGTYRRNMDIIFGQCSKHPTYTGGDRRPKCHSCRQIWMDNKRKGTTDGNGASATKT